MLRDRAYAAIRDAIVEGTLAPDELLRDQELCEWLGLSRTPVREAIARLEQDGLVVTAPQSYTRVAPLDRRAARDAFPVVAALHALAAELAVPRLGEHDLAALRDRQRALRRRACAGRRRRRARADDAFHGVFVSASANAEIPRMLDRLMPGVRRLERLRFGSLSGRASVAQHDEIIAPGREKDAQDRRAGAGELALARELIDRSFE